MNRQERVMPGMSHWRSKHRSMIIDYILNRDGLMFYELNIFDPAGHYPAKRNTDGLPDGTFEGDMAQFAQITLLIDPDATLADQDAVVSSAAISRVKTQSLATFEIPNLLPDGSVLPWDSQVQNCSNTQRTVGTDASFTLRSYSTILSPISPSRTCCSLLQTTMAAPQDRVPKHRARLMDPVSRTSMIKKTYMRILLCFIR
jgi:hypothetical protein